jgi:hypothetical protein
VDTAFAARLDVLLGDAVGWRDALAAGKEAERTRLEKEAARAQDEVKECERVAARMKQNYDACVEAGKDAKADVILEVMGDRRAQREGAQRRLEAALDALHAAATEVEGDPVQDFFDGLLADLEGRVRDANGEAKALNLIVKDFFCRVRLYHEKDGAILVVPQISGEAAQRILRKPWNAWPHAAIRHGKGFVQSPPMFRATGEESLSENASSRW